MALNSRLVELSVRSDSDHKLEQIESLNSTENPPKPESEASEKTAEVAETNGFIGKPFTAEIFFAQNSNSAIVPGDKNTLLDHDSRDSIAGSIVTNVW